MRKLLLLSLFICSGLLVHAQFPYYDINQINFVSATSLSNCNDSSAYLGDTVRTRGIVVVDGNLSEVASTSVAGGSRPFIFVVDTSSNGAAGPFRGVEVMGAYSSSGGTFPVTAVENALAGDIVEMICIVEEFEGSNQLTPISNSAVTVVGIAIPPSYTVVSVGDLNNDQRVNKLPTGEQWEGAFVELQNLTVTGVAFFSGGNRVSFDVQDQNGNLINISDRFLAQRMQAHSVVNPNSPNSVANGGPGTGTFMPPIIGTKFNYIRGLVRQSENGCSGGSGRGYELNPFDSTHYGLGSSPPSILNHERTPAVPTPAESVTVSAEITDPDGTVSSATLFYSGVLSDPAANFTSVPMTKVGASDTYEATIPTFSDGTVVRYFIEAVDNTLSTATFPITPISATEPYKMYYTVRQNGATIMDIQEPLDPNSDDVSAYDGIEVTVTGVVTASKKQHDLGFVHIQDPSSSSWAGIMLDGENNGLASVERGQIITVTGTVDEFEETTIIEVTSTTPTGNTGSVVPVVVNPSDSAFFANGGMEAIRRYGSALCESEWW